MKTRSAAAAAARSSSDLERPVYGRLRLEHVLHLAILLLALAIRLAWLGARPLHHDESIHAYYSWRILSVGPSDYRYDPVYHGPALYYLTALFERLLGPSDFSVRMLPVVSGLGLVALAWPLRTLIGRREALLYALLVTLSLTLCYYSRSLRHDVPIAFFTMAALVAFLHFIRSGRLWQAYAAGVAIGFAAATKEDIYLTAFTFANALWIVGLLRSDDAEPAVFRRANVWLGDVCGWLARHWIPIATAVIVALTIALALYTSLFTHPNDWNATAKALSYWWGQHTAKRIGGPWWYYLPIEVGYESLIFFPAAATVVSWIREGTPSRVDSLFLVWAIISFALYAWAQEKVPWLLVPALVPQTVLAAAYFADVGIRGLLFWSPLVLFTVWSLVASSYLYGAPRTSEPPESAHFEPIVYVQTTYDIPSVLAEIESTSRTLGTGKKTSLLVVGDATWPLSWYLRDYSVYWNSLPAETNAAIIICDPADAVRIGKDIADHYTQRRFAVRGWWEIDWAKISIGNVLRFLLERRVWNPTGTTDAVLFVTKDAAPNAVLPTVRLRPAPRTESYAGAPIHSAGRPLGGPGSGAGQFKEPRGIAIDRSGNLLVADSGNNRIQKLDADGNPIAAWGGPAPGEGHGEFRQPSGVAVAEDGTIYVADTWNHRIVKLDPNGNYLLDWREENPALYGPRAIAIAPDGTVFVADTGNKRVLGYDAAGKRLSSIGAEGSEPGKFVEPVGLAIDSSARMLYVADTGNHRVQVFALDGRFQREFVVPGWQEFYTEPYLAWHEGLLWATDSFNHRLNAFAPAGGIRASIGATLGGATALERPIGVAAGSDGRIIVSDFGANRLVRFDSPKGISAAAPAKIESPGALH